MRLHQLRFLATFVAQYLRHATTGRPADPAALSYLAQGTAGGTWAATAWRGIPMQKSPTDLLMYAECIHQSRPEVVVEIGSRFGGSSAWFRDVIGSGGDVITVDIVPVPFENRVPGVSYLTGDSIGKAHEAERLVAGRTCLVSLDGDHTKLNVYHELQRYSRLVQPGGYLVVEDTLLGALTNDSPAHALAEWLPRNPLFKADPSKERLGLSFCPGGWLRRETKP